ncbi:MAG: hypothetical protein V4773_06740 [Verrucomicrobiota bacterium]
MNHYLEALRIQRWDDHRYYHHSRINQSLHLLSAVSFLVAYVLLFRDPALAALVAWGVSMTSRQAGHFFFEPRGYDHVNDATHEHKEDIKVGYNLRRKVVLMSIWSVAPIVLFLSPSLFGLIEPATDLAGYLHTVGWAWLFIGLGGLLFRTVHLFFIKDVITGVVWMFKIITDPFHDIMLYWQSPIALLKGQLIDPMDHAHAQVPAHSAALNSEGLSSEDAAKTLP